MSMLVLWPVRWFVQFVLSLMERGDKGLSETLRRITAWRQRACPLCKSHKLSHVKTELWTGIPGSSLCSTYRCRGCGEELFAERYGAPMTMADHVAWREAKQMRLLSYPGFELPKATARLPGRGAQLDGK
jgi:hypothetical protein